jgi:phage protein D
MNPRQARLLVKYDNQDISGELRSHLKGWSYTDNLSGQADEIQITLEDRDSLWTGDWLPEEGAKLRPTIQAENWSDDPADPVKIATDLGEFEVDELESSGPPSTVTVKALSVPVSSSLRGEAKSRAWEKTKLSVIARDVAAGAGLKLFYDTDDDPDYDRMDQAGETDAAFLTRICQDAGLCFKVSDSQLVLFDERKYESQDPIATIERIRDGEVWRFFITLPDGRQQSARVKSYKGLRSLHDIYRACKVEYFDSDKNVTYRYTFTPPSPPNTSRVLIVNERVTSVAQAEQLAKKRLREKNREAMKFNFTTMGDLRYFSGLTLNLKGFGGFDGKYIITQVVHGQQSGYETEISLRRCLEGY